VDIGQSHYSSEYDCQVVVNKNTSLFQGVIGTIVVNNEGVPIKSTLDNATTVQYSGLLNNLVDQVQYFYFFLSPLSVLKLGESVLFNSTF
jgi:hypothetical protein